MCTSEPVRPVPSVPRAARFLSRLLFFFTVVASVTPCLAQTVFLDFNTVGQYTDNFNPWQDAGGANGGNYCYAEATTAGVNGSGGVSIFQSTDTAATYKSGSWDFSTNGATIILSTLVKANNQTSVSKIQFGILNTNVNGPYNNPGMAFETFRFIPTSSTVWSFREQYRTGNAAPVETTFNNVNVVSGRWYKFVVALTNTGPGNYNAGCAFYDYGTDGVTPGANLLVTNISHTGQTDVTVNATWPTLRGLQNAGVDVWDNFLVYQPNSKPVITLALTNTTAASGSSALFRAVAEGPGTLSYSWYTNRVLVSGTTGLTYTTPPLNATYTNVMVVAANANGSTSNSATLTVIVPTLATVTNLPASGIQATAATLNGQILATGGDTPSVTIYYGPADGGTNPGAWSNSAALGPQIGAFAQTVGGLGSNTTYYFTAKAVNSAGTAWAAPSPSFTTLASNPLVTVTAVLTYHNDNTRQGLNATETVLTPANVNSNSFGRLFTYAVDGYVYAQPLIMTNVNIPGKGTHNVVIVATEHDTVYAFDADDNSGANSLPLWQTSFLVNGETTPSFGDVGGSTDITPEVGITSTPVIDPMTGTVFVEAKTKLGANYFHRLHALDITTGLERTNFNSPGLIFATNYPGVGSGDNDGAGHVLWNPLREHCRSALTLLNGVVYIGYASHGDVTPYHGWLFGYNATNVSQQLSVYNATPNGGLGGFWQGGGGPSVDVQGNMYWQTGNGSFSSSATISLANNYSMSVMKFSTSAGLTLVDFFAPANAVNLSNGDQDLGSSAPIILPDSVGSVLHPRLVVGGGKTPPIYVMDRDNMGRFNGTSGANQIVQQFDGGPGGDRNVTPAFFNSTLYVMGSAAKISAFKITNAVFNTTPVQTPDTYANKGGATMSISANGNSSGIAWALYNAGGTSPSSACVLRAYNATNIGQLLYASDQMGSRDAAGNAVKFTLPTIANGKVYVGAQYALTVYGLASSFVATPTITPNGGLFTNSVMVTLACATPGTAIYYTLNGSVPTANSILYTTPFVLTNSVNVSAKAFKPGSIDSAVATASFLNSSEVGSGTGLRGAYYTSAFMTFPDPPTLVRTDAVVNFDWGNGSPDPSISADTFTARWTGSVQPQFTENYTFYTLTDDGVRLWINGQLIINQFVDQAPTEVSATIPMVGQQRYNIVMEYYENGGGAAASLSWSSPTTTKAIIPQTQLYPVTNPPPVVLITSPTNGAAYTTVASVTVSADADSQFNTLAKVDFYAGTTLLGTVTNVPYTLTKTGFGPGAYALTAVATDGSGLITTSAPVNITVTGGTPAAYGLTNRAPAPAFFNMPTSSGGSMPARLALTGVFSNTAALAPVAALIPYNVNVPLWSDAALKERWLAVPNDGGPYTPGEQVGFAPTGEWTFPAGTVFVKHFDLVTNEISSLKRRLETRLLVRDVFGGVYGVTYKWRADNSDADLLGGALDEDIVITTASGVRTQTWHYPSPSQCLECHTPAAGYVLGVKTRQLNGDYAYPTGTTDNQLRTLNRLGLLNPAFNETNIAGLTKMAALTNLSASLEDRARSYLDANCAQCHRPGGSGPTFDGRYDTPLVSQHITNEPPTQGDLGYDNAKIVTAKDIWRSVLYHRMNTVEQTIKMPPLARNLVDSNAVSVIADWINSLPGTPALAPPTIQPPGAVFIGSIQVSLQHTDTNAALRYTLDNTLPIGSSTLYTGPFNLTNTTTMQVKAFEDGFNESVAANAVFTILPGVLFTSANFSNNLFLMHVSGVAGRSYVVQATTNLGNGNNWVSLSTNTATATPFDLIDPGATNFPLRFYRVMELP